MAMVGLRKERIKSVVLCSDREFKAKSVILLTGAAYPAEKLNLESMDEAISRINQDVEIHNLVIDRRMYKTVDELTKALKQFADSNTNKDAKALCLLGEDFISHANELDEISPRLFIEELPLAQSQFNRAFHSKSLKGTQPAVPEFPQAAAKKQPQGKPDNPASTSSLSILETSQHIKDTIGMINEVAKDRSNLIKLQEIAQRFNGLIGAFQFFGSKTGYPELKQLAEIIDVVGKTYTERQPPTIEEHHWQLVVESAKCSYLIVKSLREETVVKAEQINSYQQILSQFEKLDDLNRKESFSQDQVDQLIASGE